MRVRLASLLSVLALTALLAVPVPVSARQIPAPEQFFGFAVGAEGELAELPTTQGLADVVRAAKEMIQEHDLDT